MRITDRLVRIPSGDGKPKAIREVIKKNPDAAFGNSRWDADMLEIARYAFAIKSQPGPGKDRAGARVERAFPASWGRLRWLGRPLGISLPKVWNRPPHRTGFASAIAA